MKKKKTKTKPNNQNKTPKPLVFQMPTSLTENLYPVPQMASTTLQSIQKHEFICWILNEGGLCSYLEKKRSINFQEVKLSKL